MTEGFPLLRGLPGSLARSVSGWNALFPLLAVAATLGFIASGIDDVLREVLLRANPPRSPPVRGLELVSAALWPVLPALLLARNGFLRGDRAAAHAGCAVLQTVIVVGVVVAALKLATGRPRPEDATNAREWYPFAMGEMRVMWPSGHTAESVGAAAAFASYYRSTRLTLIVAAIAGVVGTAMLVESFHWASDVVAGAFLAFPVGRTIGTSFRESLTPPASDARTDPWTASA